MLKIRLKKIGNKKFPFYRIVVIDSRKKNSGKYIELIGTYNPKNGECEINENNAYNWLLNGAQPTDTVRNLLSKKKILYKLHLNNNKNNEINNNK